MATGNTIDVLLDADFEDKIQNGDFAVGDGTLDDCLIIFKLNKGGLKSNVLIGPELQNMLNNTLSPSQIQQVLLLNLKMDGKVPKTLTVVNGQIKMKM